MMLLQLRLVVPKINMTCRAGHEELYDSLRFRRMMQRLQHATLTHFRCRRSLRTSLLFEQHHSSRKSHKVGTGTKELSSRNGHGDFS